MIGDNVESMDLLMLDYTLVAPDEPKIGSTMHINHEYIPTNITIREDTWEAGQAITVSSLKNESIQITSEVTDNRKVIECPQKPTPHKWGGHVTAVYNLPNGEVMTKRSTGWKFTEDWVMTAAHIVFDPDMKVFADSITFHPAVSGLEENSPYAPIPINRAVIHPNYRLNAGHVDPENMLDYSFLLLNPDYERPEGYLGFYYQHDYFYTGESFAILSYPSDLPADVDESKKGTYMYSQVVKHNGYAATTSVVYSGIRTAGDAGAPVYWYDYSGKLCCIGILGMNAGPYNEVIKFKARDFSMMRYLKRHYPAEMAYIQPPKPSTDGLSTINSLIPMLKKVENEYVKYYTKTFTSLLTSKEVVTGLTKFLRHKKGDNLIGWNMLEQVKPDGKIGSETLAAMPILNQSSNEENLICILQCALCCNKYSVDINGIYNDAVVKVVQEFQQNVGLTSDPMVVSGEVNRRTWAALLQSKGDPDRKANACDCTEKLDLIKAKALKEAGYNFVGRYLSNASDSNKGITKEELDIITTAGLNVFAIYQEGSITPEYFSEEQGKTDAVKAFEAARVSKIPNHEVIYFGVGYDFTEQGCREKVIPYFSGIVKAMKDKGSWYKVGIYAPRNICNIIIGAKLAESLFIADKSTAYSGNLGYALPDNWAFDQYETETMTGNGTKFQFNKVIASGVYAGFNGLTRCGHENYRDCTLHDMVLETSDEDGGIYYVCQACGYKVKAPSMQDKDILSLEDNLRVKSGYIFQTYYSALLKEGIVFSDLDTNEVLAFAMQQIRATYPAKYEFCDKDGICLREFGNYLSEPFKESPLHSLDYFRADTTADIGIYLIETLEKVIGFFSPTANLFLNLQTVADVLADPTTYYANGISAIMAELASKTGIKALELLFLLTDIGIEIPDSLDKYMEDGDHVIKFMPTNQHVTESRLNAIVWSPDLRVKAIIFKINMTLPES